MSKVLCMTLCVIILISCFVPAYALETKDDDEIIRILNVIKPRIPQTEQYDEFSASVRKYNESTSYDFEWHNTNENKYMSVSANDDGIITRFYVGEDNRSYDSKPTLNKLSLDEALKNAESLLIAINPDLKNKIKIIKPRYNNLYGNEYVFDIRRIENGVEVKGNDGNIRIDGDAEKIISFYINYTSGLQFDDKDLFISADAAQEAYEVNFGMMPVYNIVYEKDSTVTTELVYMPSHKADTYINALDSSVYTYNPDYSLFGSSGGGNLAMKESVSMDTVATEFRFSEAETTEINKISGLLSTEDIISELFGNKLLALDSTMEVSGTSLSRDGYDENKYYYNISMHTEDREKGCNIRVDAQNSEIISYNRYDYTIDRTQSVRETMSNDEAVKYAEELAKNYFTDDENNTYKLVENTDGRASYIRIVNGIECNFDGIDVSLNKYDGKLDYFHVSHTNVEFASPETAIDVQKANDILFDNFDYTPVYLIENGSDTAAVYDFEYSRISVNAFDGKINYPTSDDEISEYTDISNHYAQEQINALGRFGIGFAGGKYYPDKKITQGEYLSLLSAVFSSGVTPIILRDDYDYSSMYRYAERYGILSDEINENKILTRENACVMMVNAMGYREVASVDGIFVNKFGDTKNNIGYIAILNGLGVINGDGSGNFYPERELTRGEAAVILYNYLSK